MFRNNSFVELDDLLYDVLAIRLVNPLLLHVVDKAVSGVHSKNCLDLYVSSRILFITFALYSNVSTNLTRCRCTRSCTLCSLKTPGKSPWAQIRSPMSWFAYWPGKASYQHRPSSIEGTSPDWKGTKTRHECLWVVLLYLPCELKILQDHLQSAQPYSHPCLSS